MFSVEEEQVMLRVHVCEDQKEQRERLETFIKETIQVENLSMELGIVTANPEEMLEGVKREQETGICFLDIELQHKMNGMELAKKIREYQPRCFIIFVTTHSEMSYMTFTYKVEAMDFIIKDDIRELKNRVHQCLLNCKERYQENMEKIRKSFQVKVGSKVKEVSYDEILFFEVAESYHKVLLHTKSSVIEFNGKLKQIEESLDNQFYRCHRSYLVNVDKIVEKRPEEGIIIMEGGESCPISVRMGKTLLKSK